VTFGGVIVQILMLDIVFSLDSVITAVGMVKQIEVMIAAVILAMIVMLVFVNKISAFVDRHPTIKMLALSFLILIGTMLVAEGFHQHINKGYIYFAMTFALGVEMLNLRLRRRWSCTSRIAEPAWPVCAGPGPAASRRQFNSRHAVFIQWQPEFAGAGGVGVMEIERQAAGRWPLTDQTQRGGIGIIEDQHALPVQARGKQTAE
jgi:hypothetical protein